MAREGVLFWHLLTMAILLRTSMTVFDVPHNALNAELTPDYHARTSLANYKVAGVQIAGYLMVIAMYSIWLQPTDTDPSGVLNKDGYQSAGMIGAIIILVSMFLAALTLRKRANPGSSIYHEESLKPRAFLSQLNGSLKVKSFRALLLAGVFSAVGTGLFIAMWAYVMSYFWELNADETSYILLANFLGALIGGISGPYLLTRNNKRNSAIALSLLFLLVGAAPYVLRFADLLPANVAADLLICLAIHGVFQIMISVWLTVIVASMTTDIVEAGVLESGDQNEGFLMAATTFIQKAGTGGGLIMSGVILSLISFPDQALVSDVDPMITRDHGLYFVLATSALYFISIVFLLG